MHELSLASAIVATVERHAAGRRVTQVDLRVGTLRQVVPETLAFYFAFVARDRVCDGADLEIEVVQARLRCEECAHDWSIEIPAFRCPACGSASVTVATGNEFCVESIEIEEVACIAAR